MKTKTCVTCKTPYEYETEEELKKFFYKKGAWFRNTCIDCERSQNREKYHNGQYNYNKRRESGYKTDSDYTLGTLPPSNYY